MNIPKSFLWCGMSSLVFKKRILKVYFYSPTLIWFCMFGISKKKKKRQSQKNSVWWFTVRHQPPPPPGTLTALLQHFTLCYQVPHFGFRFFYLEWSSGASNNFSAGFYMETEQKPWATTTLMVSEGLPQPTPKHSRPQLCICPGLQGSFTSFWPMYTFATTLPFFSPSHPFTVPFPKNFHCASRALININFTKATTLSPSTFLVWSEICLFITEDAVPLPAAFLSRACSLRHTPANSRVLAPGHHGVHRSEDALYALHPTSRLCAVATSSCPLGTLSFKWVS